MATLSRHTSLLLCIAALKCHAISPSQTFRRFLRRKARSQSSPCPTDNGNPAVCRVQIPNAAGPVLIQTADVKYCSKTDPVPDLPSLWLVKNAQVKQSSLTSRWQQTSAATSHGWRWNSSSTFISNYGQVHTLRQGTDKPKQLQLPLNGRQAGTAHRAPRTISYTKPARFFFWKIPALPISLFGSSSWFWGSVSSPVHGYLLPGTMASRHPKANVSLGLGSGTQEKRTPFSCSPHPIWQPPRQEDSGWASQTNQYLKSASYNQIRHLLPKKGIVLKKKKKETKKLHFCHSSTCAYWSLT